MQLSAKRPAFAVSRIALLGVAAFLMLGFAAAIAYDKTIVAYAIFGLAALPVLLYLAYRWPIVFPFGVYALGVPFDPLLKASNGTGGTLTKVIGFVTIAALLVHAFRLRRLNAPPVSWFAWCAYLLWLFAGWAWSISGDETGGGLQIMGSLFALYTVAAIYPIGAREYVWARRSVVVAGGFTAAYGLYAFASGQIVGGGSGRLSLRMGSLQIDPNHYAAFFAIPIAIIVAKFFITTNVRERIICAALVLPMFLNVLLTGSRGGLIDVTIVIAYLGFRARKFALLGAAFASALALSLAVPNSWQRILDPSQGDASGRGEIWNVGLEAAKRYGIFGSGFSTFPDVYDDNLHNGVQRAFAGFHRPAHNILIQTIVELGIPGLVFLLAAWWTSIQQNRSIPRGTPYFADRIAYEAALIGLLVSALTIDLIWFKYLWLCLMLVVMLANVVRPRLLLGRPPVVRRRRAMPAATVREHVRL